jgi:hypothetical protein
MIIFIGDVKRDAGDSGTYLLTLANGNDPTCVTSSKVIKASTTSVAVAGVIALTFASVNTG